MKHTYRLLKYSSLYLKFRFKALPKYRALLACVCVCVCVRSVCEIYFQFYFILKRLLCREGNLNIEWYSCRSPKVKHTLSRTRQDSETCTAPASYWGTGKVNKTSYPIEDKSVWPSAFCYQRFSTRCCRENLSLCSQTLHTNKNHLSWAWMTSLQWRWL